MAASTQIEMAASSTSADFLQGIEEQAILAAYQQTQKHGLEFGRLCYEYREKHKSEGGYGSKGKGLVQLLDEFSIPKSTCYFWIHKYEVSIGVRKDTEPFLVCACLACGADRPKGVTCECGNSHSLATLVAREPLTNTKVLERADYFLKQSAEIPNNFREELQSRNLLTPELDAKLTRVAQAANVTPAAPAVEETIPTIDAVNFPAKQSFKVWTHADEKRANRSEPLASEDAVITLALKIIDAGVTALKDSEDPSHLYAAAQLAKRSLQYDPSVIA